MRGTEATLCTYDAQLIDGRRVRVTGHRVGDFAVRHHTKGRAIDPNGTALPAGHWCVEHIATGLALVACDDEGVAWFMADEAAQHLDGVEHPAASPRWNAFVAWHEAGSFRQRIPMRHWAREHGVELPRIEMEAAHG